MYVQPLEGSLVPGALAAPAGAVAGDAGPFAGSPLAGAGDNISRFVPPWQSDAPTTPFDQLPFGQPGSMQGPFGPIMGLLQQLVGMLQSMMGYGSGAPYGSGSCQPYGSGNCQPNGSGNCRPYGGGEHYFQNANGSSEGDPHLSFNGQHWNSMASQPDLLSSNSFRGGFRISTQATVPNEKGVTWNQSATVALDNGSTTIAMNKDGDPTITRDGRPIPIVRGQTLQLGDGESVTYQRNGSLLVSAESGDGGRIATTLSAQGNGVNVDVTAHDVDLGGALVNGDERRPVPASGMPVPAGWQ